MGLACPSAVSRHTIYSLVVHVHTSHKKSHRQKQDVDNYFQIPPLEVVLADVYLSKNHQTQELRSLV